MENQFSNKDKKEHGKNAKDALEQILLECKKYNYIKEIIKDYRSGYKLYDNKQFYCNFVIVFNDDTKWIVNITTSFRTDRLKGNQWDSYNIKEIDKSISKSILVYPDSIPQVDKDAFISHKLLILNKNIFSAIDNIVGQTELFELIEEYANSNLSVGQKKDKQGKNFESFVAAVLSNKDNLERWRTENKKIVGMNFDFFKNLVNCFRLDKYEIISIIATEDKKKIGNLATFGSPKTDVIARCITESGKDFYFTISCKKTSENFVSVHQYSADTFADVLDSDNNELRILLNDFQKVGGIQAFGEERSKELEAELKPYLFKLVNWVLSGAGGMITNKFQIADYILVYDEGISEISIHTVDDYINILLRNENTVQFGTPFRWTFASGRKGKDIQLKMKIIK